MPETILVTYIFSFIKEGKQKMKTFSKLLALILALSLVFGMSAAVFGAQSSSNTITVNGAKAGETYSAYKMLELFVDDVTNPTAYRYTVAPDWADFFANDNIAVWGTVLEKDATGTYFQGKSGVASETAWSATSDLSAFAEAAAAYAADRGLTPVDTDTPTGDTAVLETTESGYYLITSTLGSRAMVDTTPGNVTINEKNEEDSITKSVKEDSSATYAAANDAQIGDVVEFKSVATIVPRTVNVKIHDTMDSGLTLVAGSIHIYTDDTLTTEYTGATVKTGADAETGDTFTILIPDAFAADATASQNLYIVYTATLNAGAVVKDGSNVSIVAQKNTTAISFGAEQSKTSQTTTTTHKFDVFKHAKDSTANLANAIFQLKKGDAVVNLIKLDEINYRVADATETSTAATHVAANNEVANIAAGTLVQDFVTVGTGNIVIWGVDADSDYKLHEVQAPKGYNVLAAEISIEVNADNTFEAAIENNSGAELPSTGGIGTTIFYVAGAILVIGAGVLLVSRKKAGRGE